MGEDKKYHCIFDGSALTHSRRHYFCEMCHKEYNGGKLEEFASTPITQVRLSSEKMKEAMERANRNSKSHVIWEDKKPSA